MSTLVLVHGGWQGGWCWKKVRPLLLAAGHNVFTPTLTGLGERSHLLTPKTDLEVHIQDIVAMLHYEALDDVILVGHSYSGMVITGVADKVPERLSQLIYLDAFVPENGQSAFDTITPEYSTRVRKLAEDEGSGCRVPPPPVEQWGITSPEDTEWMKPRMGFHPLKSLTQPIKLKIPTLHELPRTFIRCLGSPSHHYDAISEMVRDNPRWRYHEMSTGHEAMITDPKELADLLARLL